MKPIRIAIAGVTGRTGSTIARLASADKHFQIVAALAHESDGRLGADLGTFLRGEPLDVAIGTDCGAACDALIDFTQPAATVRWAQWCAQSGTALVSGTTGLSAEDQMQLRAAAQKVPVVWAPNMSIGVNLLLGLVADVAARLGEDWDVELVEAHHRHKRDAPSGTAQALLSAVCSARGVSEKDVAVYGRQGEPGARTSGEIGVHAVRMGEVVGDHTMTFCSANEALVLEHRAFSRDAFAAGALHAARWAVGRKAGFYGMRDVLASTGDLP